MKKQTRTIIIVLLNVLFCAALLWFFSRNAFLRPFLGSAGKEALSGVMLLATLYANYYILYPKLYRGHMSLYWLLVVIACFATGGVELAIGYPFIVKCNALAIQEYGSFYFFSKRLLFVFSRNLAFNFFPFMFRERQELLKALDKEVQIVYQDARLLDVADNDHNMRLISKDDIFYCQQDGNYTRIYVTQDDPYYSRYGSMKYLEQLFGSEEFVRVSNTLLIPYRYIHSCNGTEVFMKQLPWQKEQLSFAIEPKYLDQAPGQIALYLLTSKGQETMKPPKQNRKRRKPVKPSQDKTDAVLQYIKEHAGSQTKEIAENTQFSPTTVERCLAELRKQGLVKYKGSKKTGGYCVVGAPQERTAAETAHQGEVSGKKVLKEKADKKKLTEEKPAEPSSKE